MILLFSFNKKKKKKSQSPEEWLFVKLQALLTSSSRMITDNTQYIKHYFKVCEMSVTHTRIALICMTGLQELYVSLSAVYIGCRDFFKLFL